MTGPEQPYTDIEIAASVAAENNPEIFAEEHSRRSVIEKIKGFVGGVATALGQAEKDSPISNF